MASIKPLTSYDSLNDAIEYLLSIREQAIVPWTVSDIIVASNRKDFLYFRRRNRREVVAETPIVNSFKNIVHLEDADYKEIRITTFYPGCLCVGIHDEVLHYEQVEGLVFDKITDFISSIVDSGVSVNFDPKLRHWYCNKELVASYAKIYKDDYKFSGPSFYILDPKDTNMSIEGEESKSVLWKKSPICHTRDNNSFINKFTSTQYTLEEFNDLISPILEDAVF